VKGELYVACTEYAKLAPLPMVEELRTFFARAGTTGEIELYPGVHHGSAFPQRWWFDKPAAARHWERLIRSALPTNTWDRLYCSPKGVDPYAGVPIV